MNTKELAKQIRISSLKMCHKAKASHIGGCLSCADILAVLYNDILKNDDRLIISKGHCAAAVYSALALTGKIPMEWLDRYCEDGAELGGHVTYGVPRVEVSTGSLGHGLSIGCGMALADRKQRVFVLMSDGEFDEGSVWESVRFAGKQDFIGNLVVIIDANELKSFSEEPYIHHYMWGSLERSIYSFQWGTCEVDGHDLFSWKHLSKSINKYSGHSPQVIIARTVKGKGVSFMEGKLEWHYKYPNDEELNQALKELNG